MKTTYRNAFVPFLIVVVCLLTAEIVSAAWQFVSAAPVRKPLTASLHNHAAQRQVVKPSSAIAAMSQSQLPLTSGSVLELRNGQIVCRTATEREAQAMRHPVAENLHVLRDDKATLDATAQPQSGLKIVLRATPQLEQYPAAKAAFLRAAHAWEALIQTPITVVIDVDYGPTAFGKLFEKNAYGQTRFQREYATDYYSTLRSLLIRSAGSPEEAALYNALPTGQLPTDLGATTTLIYHIAPLRALGGHPPVAEPEKENLGLPPGIAFNSDINFDFDPSDGIAPKRWDFNAAAMHEIGHALGFFSGVGINELFPDEPPLPESLDLFRFRPGVTSETFATTPRVLSASGEHVFFGSKSELPFSTGRFDGTGGDGWQAGHWKDDRGVTGQYIGIMDPVFGWGHRYDLTANDRVAFETLGYRTNPLPTPGESELKIDDGAREDDAIGNGVIVLNRLTPPSYPATLRKLRIMIPVPVDKSNIAGKPITLIYGYVNSHAWIDTLQTTIPSASNDLFLEFPIPDGLTINAGDFYVGYQAPSPHQGVAFAVDFSGAEQKRSFVSTDNGKSYAPLSAVFQGKPANAMIRAIISTPAPTPPPPSPTPTPTPAPNTVAITSGVPLDGYMGRHDPYGVVSETQYTIQVPRGATKLKIELEANTDVDLYANFGKCGTVQEFVPLADFGSVSDDHYETITITPDRSPALKEGVYYLMIVNYGPGPSTFKLTATVTRATGKVTCVSAASYDGAALASEAIASAFGTNLATVTQEAPPGHPLPMQLGGTQVTVKDSLGMERAALLFFVSPNQVNYQVPPDTALGTATVTVMSGDGTVSVGTVQIASIAPGLFTANADGKGVPAAQLQCVKPDGTSNYESVAQYDSAQQQFVPLPLDLGAVTDQTYLLLYSTGIRHQQNLGNISVRIGGVEVPVLYAGKQHTYVGLDQINVLLPRSLIGCGVADVVLTVAGKTANTVRINLK